MATATQPEPTSTPTPAPDITGLPTFEGDLPDVPITGTVSELLTLGKNRKAAPAKAAKEPEKKEPKNTGDVDDKLKGFLADHFKGKKPKVRTADPSQEPVEPTDAPAPDPEPKPAKAKKTAVVKDKSVEMAERFADLERKRLDLEREKFELEKARSRHEPTQPVQTLDHLSDDERYELEVLQHMAKQNPSKYGELPKKYTDVAKATLDYKTKWEADHSGDQFDPEDSEHDAFFAKNQVRYEKKDFKSAEIALATPDKPKDESAQKEIRELKAKERVREVMPRAMQVFANSVESLLDSIDPAMAKAAREGGREKLVEEFPGEADEVLKAAASIEAVSIEAHKILETDGLVEIDGNNRLHNLIVDLIRRKEPVTIGTQDSEGRPFATWAQWAQMSDQQRAGHWHLGAEEIVDILTQDLSRVVKGELDRVNKLVESRLSRPVSAPAKAAAPKPAPSPSSASRVTVDTSNKLRTNQNDQFQKTISSVLFKRAS